MPIPSESKPSEGLRQDRFLCIATSRPQLQKSQKPTSEALDASPPRSNYRRPLPKDERPHPSTTEYRGTICGHLDYGCRSRAQWMANSQVDKLRCEISTGIMALDQYRQLRILSSIFLAVEQHGVLPRSLGYPEFHFEYEGTITGASLGPVNRHSHSPQSNLRFVVLDPNPNVSVALAEWSDGDSLLEDKISEIAGSILAATRAAAQARREQTKSSLAAALVGVLEEMRELEEAGADRLADRRDPWTLQEMADRHRAAAAARRLSKTIAEGSVVVADLPDVANVTSNRSKRWVRIPSGIRMLLAFSSLRKFARRS